MSFGRATAIRGNSAVIGRPTVGGPFTGSAFVFEYNQSQGWMQVQELLPPDGGAQDFFGDAVAIEGDVLAVGARSHDHPGLSASGAVYIFRRRGPQWVFEQELLPPKDAPSGLSFGRLLEFDGDRLVVTLSGSVLLYRLNGDSWNLEQTLSAPFQISFGASISLDGDVLVVGATTDASMCPGGMNSGLVFVFRFNGKQWVQEQTLSPSTAACNRLFGLSVAVSGHTLVATDSWPRAYIFEYDQGSKQWIETTAFVHPPGFGATDFGQRPRSTAIRDDTIIIGANSSSIGPPGAGGAAFVYQRTPEGQWVQRDILLPQPNPWSNFFGWSVWLDNGRAIVGAHGEDHQSGAAYIFDLQPPAADFNCDGVVNGLDLGILLINWSIPPGMPGCNGATPCAADLNGDGLVNGLDLGLLLANWTLQ
jgi:hypothetical protein